MKEKLLLKPIHNIDPDKTLQEVWTETDLALKFDFDFFFILKCKNET